MSPSPSDTTSPAAAAPDPSLAGRFIGVLTAPRRTYAAVVRHPAWLAMLIAIIMIRCVVTFTFLSTEVGRSATLDMQITQAESYGRQLTETQIARLEQFSQYSRYIASASQAIALPIVALILSGIAFGIFNGALGSDATFRRTFAIVVHSGVVLTLQALFATPLAYTRQSLASTTSLVVFAPFLDDNSFAARALGAIDLFILWWILSFAIGLGVLHRKRTAPIATTLIVIYVVIGLVIAGIKTAVSGA